MNFLADLEREAEPVRDRVRVALENGTRLRIVGARSWLDAGRTVSADEDLEATNGGIVEYVPGDLTITVRAGTPLADIAHTVAANHQWLPLDPFGDAAGTIGATIATGSAGPLAHAFGTPRDQVIGLGFVTGRGDYVRSGGRVVKNVAGFDLTRLLIGSWGTLGVITDATLRLRARPAADATVALVLSEESTRWRQALEQVADAPLASNAMELLNGAMSDALGLERDPLLLVRLGGNEEAVAAQRAVLARIGEIRDLEVSVWKRLRAIEPEDAAVARFSGPLAEFPSLWRQLERALEAAQPLLHATLARGIVRCIVPAHAARDLLTVELQHAGIARIFERLPADAWAAAPFPANDALSRRVRDAFDPAHILNPGILGQTVQ